MNKEIELAEELLRHMAKKADLQVGYKMIVKNCDDRQVAVAKIMTLMSDYTDGVPEWDNLKGGYSFYQLNPKGLAFVSDGAWSGIREADKKESQLKLYELELAKETNEISRTANKIAEHANEVSACSNRIAWISGAIAVLSLLVSLKLLLFS